MLVAVARLTTHEDLLAALRAIDGMRERTPGRFYVRSRPFLHFHGMLEERCADLRTGADWERLPAATARDRAALVKRVEQFFATK